MKNNIGEAILILGCIYMIIYNNIPWYGLIGLFSLIILAALTWGHHYNPKEGLENLKLTNEKLRLEIELMKAQTQFYIAQGAAIMRRLKT